jgi:TonB family protein
MRRAVAFLFIALVIAGGSVARAEDESAQPAAGQITKPPKLSKFIEAVYPEDKKAAGVTSQVLLSIEIGDDGQVGEVEVLQSGGADFDTSAVKAAKQFVFEPAEIDGKPAPVKIAYRYEFKIEEKIFSLGPQINFEGVILERFKKRPLEGVTVKLKDLDVSAVTGKDGAFAFTDVPVGTHQVELSGANLITVATEENIEKSKKRTVKYFLEEKEVGVDEEVVVRAARIKKEAVETTIRTEEARRVPGTQGDTLKVVQNLPGVGRSAFGSGQLVVWGSAPKDTRVVVDGVDLPALYHVGGLRSTVNADLVKSIELAPGSYGADYGRGLGGLVKVETKNAETSGLHGYVAADFIDASGMLSYAATPKLRFEVAGRASYLDKLLKVVTSQDVGDYVPIPRYDDYQARVSLGLRKDEQITALFLASDDHLKRTIYSDDPSQRRFENSDTSFKRFMIRYTRLLEDGASVVVTPSFGLDTSATEAKFGSVPTKLSSTSWRYGLRASYRRKLAPFATLTIGTDLAGAVTSVSRVGSVNLPAREGDVVVFGQPPGDGINADDWSTHIASAGEYAVLELTFGALKLNPGLRLEPFLLDGSRMSPRVQSLPPVGYTRMEFVADPRLTASYALTKRLSFNAGFGVYHQPPDPDSLSAVFGNPTLSLEKAVHANGGTSFKLTGTLTLELVGFYKKLSDLISRSSESSPPLARALTQDGVGRIYGGQLLLRQELFKGFFGWITYSLIRSERKDHPTSAWRLFDYDQTHVFAALASYQFAKGWEGGVRFRYTSGVPLTPVVDAFYDARGDQYQPVFGARNSERLASFMSLDARIERTLTFQRYKVNLFLDVQNLTNRKNPEVVIYNYDYSTRKTISGLPILAVAGGRVEF